MIKLVTISRISKEKGFERMLHLEQLLIASGVAFVWNCYGDDTTQYAKDILLKFRAIKFQGVTQTPLQVMKAHDYVVQLSDTEGFPYSVYEAMSAKVPVIATDFPSIQEMLIDGENGYILSMDLSNFDINKLLKIPVIKTFTEKSSERTWIKFLNDMANNTKSTGANKGAGPGRKKTVDVIASRKYFDTVLQRYVSAGEQLKVDAQRAQVLADAEVAAVLTIEKPVKVQTNKPAAPSA